MSGTEQSRIANKILVLTPLLSLALIGPPLLI